MAAVVAAMVAVAAISTMAQEVPKAIAGKEGKAEAVVDLEDKAKAEKEGRGRGRRCQGEGRLSGRSSRGCRWRRGSQSRVPGA